MPRRNSTAFSPPFTPNLTTILPLILSLILSLILPLILSFILSLILSLILPLILPLFSPLYRDFEMGSLQDITPHNIVDVFGPTERRCIVKCRALDLIPVKDPAFYACPTCNGPVGKRDKPSEKLGYTFRCKAKGCGKTLSPLANTIFERSKLPLLTILTAVYWFVNEVTRAQASSFLKVSEPSITALWKKLRRACGQLGSWNQIGGENLIVECDETHVFRKYHRGRALAGEDRWIFGAFCR